MCIYCIEFIKFILFTTVYVIKALLLILVNGTSCTIDIIKNCGNIFHIIALFLGNCLIIIQELVNQIQVQFKYQVKKVKKLRYRPYSHVYRKRYNTALPSDYTLPTDYRSSTNFPNFNSTTNFQRNYNSNYTSPNFDFRNNPDLTNLINRSPRYRHFYRRQRNNNYSN